MRDVQQLLEALASPIRRQILTLTWHRELPAGEIAAAFDVTAPTISSHLAVLRDADLVTVHRDGNFRRYRARQDVLRGLHGALAGNAAKWTPADDIPEHTLAHAETRSVVVAQVTVNTNLAKTFQAFTDAELYSRWMGVPVEIIDGRFSCTLEWGTRVEGVYEQVDPPNLIAMRWDFEDDNIPIPGNGMVGYLRFTAADTGCHVEVHQLVDSPEHTEFIQMAWTLVLGRLKAGVVAAVDQRLPGPSRRPRPKRQRAS